ncbi:hypothetical protein N7539_005431 [Penicillium diatomitis]|uniref:Alpha-1,6-mannosyltransferase n=1 Tax=Penicillium diatomitis TaxID=2819901 RepID=A0A9X0BUQ0_9EURO|nr:uncharacterized protein N7539_005431 [Penicillium diatomitis]KAJ5485443.1 hypothetical protein N7539_005431 [Penicillium diatomitis]
MASRRHVRRQVSVVFVLLALLSLWHLHSRAGSASGGPAAVNPTSALLTKYVSNRRGSGGAWYIPPSWIGEHDPQPAQNIVEAATLALNASRRSPERQIPHSVIPLILHQTWKDTYPEQWPETFQRSTETWLADLDHGNMAYFLWDDSGIAQFMRHFEPEMESRFYALPNNVERSDVFRVLVSKWIGGVYGDMDTEPTKPPSQWIDSTDLQPWQDQDTGKTYSSSEPVRAIVGLEADCRPESDDYWRMGYLYPIQLTQWSFAWAPDHPILQRFVDRLLAMIKVVSDAHEGQLESTTAQADLYSIDTLNLTGPVAFTDSVQSWLEDNHSLRWNALTGLDDGGLSKLVGDVLILPITGFSPGRSHYGNMGSKPITDPSARLLHHAQGSWRSSSIFVEYGKFCRTVFGLCKDWSKVPHNWII